MMRKPDGSRLMGARNISLPLLARMVYIYGNSNGEVDRGVVDRTRLDGTFDFTMEYAPSENDRLSRSVPTGPNGSNPGPPPRDALGPTFREALRKQLGLKLESDKGTERVLIVDHIEKPSADQ
jgi:bla regulator protein blaR1